MVNRLPAVLIGGPPHAGKSVLFYNLTQALRERNIRHHAIRACLDGEGNWFQEGEPDTVSRIRLPIKGEWPEAFVKRICLDLEHRCLPFLVDMGGHPRESQLPILRQCTHAVLLLRLDKEEDAQRWQQLVTDCNLLPLAHLYSQQHSTSTITARSPLLEGIITGLERHDMTPLAGPVFKALVDLISDLFTSYSPQALEQIYFEQAPTELVLDLYEALRTFTTSTRWETDMLAPLLNSVPAQTPLAVYGAGPNWLYAALAAHADPQPFYLFDPRYRHDNFGWLQPVAVQISDATFPELDVTVNSNQDMAKLSITFPTGHLDYFQPDSLPFPPVPVDAGLIVDGRLPFWLLTAVVRLYKQSGVSWIAPYYAQANKAVVAYSRVENRKVGEYVSIPLT